MKQIVSNRKKAFFGIVYLPRHIEEPTCHHADVDFGTDRISNGLKRFFDLEK